MRIKDINGNTRELIEVIRIRYENAYMEIGTKKKIPLECLSEFGSALPYLPRFVKLDGITHYETRKKERTEYTQLLRFKEEKKAEQEKKS